MELLDGSRLIVKEKRGLAEPGGTVRRTRSVNMHEAGFIQYLDSGTWHLAFYNDGKNVEQVSYSTIIIGECRWALRGGGRRGRITVPDGGGVMGKALQAPAEGRGIA